MDNRIGPNTPLPNIGANALLVKYQQTHGAKGVCTVIDNGDGSGHLTVHADGKVNLHGSWENGWKNTLLSQAGNVIKNNSSG